MAMLKRNQTGFGTVEGLIAVAAVLVVSVVGIFVFRHQQKPSVERNSAPSNSQTSSQQRSSALTRTYTSGEEKASFKYPASWTVTTADAPSNEANADSVGLRSPSGSITISWISAISGFGNESGTLYPLHTVIDKTPISSATGYYVVSGVTTLDGATYYPWIAVQDSNGILSSGVAGTLVTFTGKHNKNSSTSAPTDALFSTSGVRVTQNSPPLTKDQATAWFSGSEAQQAKLILLSFSDQN